MGQPGIPQKCPAGEGRGFPGQQVARAGLCGLSAPTAPVAPRLVRAGKGRPHMPQRPRPRHPALSWVLPPNVPLAWHHGTTTLNWSPSRSPTPACLLSILLVSSALPAHPITSPDPPPPPRLSLWGQVLLEDTRPAPRPHCFFLPRTHGHALCSQVRRWLACGDLPFLLNSAAFHWLILPDALKNTALWAIIHGP